VTKDQKAENLDPQAVDGADLTIPTCPNCGELRSGPHCAWCGQNDRDYKRSAWSLVGDFFRETFELDSKLFRTLKLLVLKPGCLSAEFSRNRRASYVSPMRLYLFASVVYLTSITLGQSDGSASATAEANQPPPMTSEEADATVAPSSPLLPTEAELSYLRELLPPRSGRKLDELLSRRDGLEMLGAYLLPAGDLAAKDPGAASLAERVLWAGLIDFLHDPGFLQDQFYGLSVGLVLLVPIQALMLALVYYRKKRYFAEHLVFQAHVQTFSFLAISALVLLPSGLIGALVTLIVSGWTLYYLAAAMRHFYEDSWMRTLVNACLLLVLYMAVVTPMYFVAVAMGM
jgi:hypothetical protein